MKAFADYWRRILVANPALAREEQRLTLTVSQYRKCIARAWHDAQKLERPESILDQLFKGRQ